MWFKVTKGVVSARSHGANVALTAIASLLAVFYGGLRRHEDGDINIED